MKTKAVNRIFAALENNARFVGGAVRDSLIGRYARDIDIATPFLPDEVIKRLKQNGIKVIPTGIKHGTVTALSKGKHFEITTLRTDIENFGRHAKVSFTDDWEKDAARRDFTINAMYCSQEGEIFDFFGGQADLQARRLRFVGEAAVRCKEDYLRILRYFRFFAYYGSEVDMEALMACKELRAGIEGLSGERIYTEMRKLLRAPNPLYSLQLMVQTGVIEHVIPSITQSNIVFLERLLELKAKPARDHILRLAVLIGKNSQAAGYVAQRWRLSNIEKRRLLFLCDIENKIPLGSDIDLAKKILRKCGIENFLDMALIGFAYGMDATNFEILYALKDWEIPVFPISGGDITSLGVSGKEVGAILKAAEDWWEEGAYMADKDAILEFLKNR